MSEHRILVTEPIPETVIDFLSTLGRVDVGVKGEFNNEDHLADVLPKYDALLCMLSTPVTEKVLTNASKLKIVANFAVGYNNIDVAAADHLKIKVANRYFYPDASIVCGKAVFTDDMNDVVLNPTVLFEILSPSSAAYDRGVKFLSYQGIESLREYVLISQDEEIVETYRRHLESSWLYSRAEAELHLDSVGVKVRVCDLYED